jgi:hypothetical protein
MAIISAGFSINSYKEYAFKNGWPIGKLYMKHGGWMVTIAIIAILTGIVELFYVTKWYFALLLILLSFVFSGILTKIFKQNTQWIAFIILLASLIVYMILGAEVVTQP